MVERVRLQLYRPASHYRDHSFFFCFLLLASEERSMSHGCRVVSCIFTLSDILPQWCESGGLGQGLKGGVGEMLWVVFYQAMAVPGFRKTTFWGTLYRVSIHAWLQCLAAASHNPESNPSFFPFAFPNLYFSTWAKFSAPWSPAEMFSSRKAWLQG